ncbi:MAG TPA: glutaredoxin family protein [Candidatus Polarisedimenticolaceae bacterium]|nr:glutaredoxin family protein [Candidatus Polarisedimenticolaceae bacterium]
MPQVTIFSTTTCKYCKEVKEFLTAHNQAYEEILLDQKPEYIQESVALSGSRGVPVTKIVRDDGSVVGVLGWDQPALEEALQLA